MRVARNWPHESSSNLPAALVDLLVLVLALTLAQTLVLVLALLLLLHLGCSRKFQLGRSGYTKGGPWEQ